MLDAENRRPQTGSRRQEKLFNIDYWNELLFGNLFLKIGIYLGFSRRDVFGKRLEFRILK
jgi:hypothetical protein